MKGTLKIATLFNIPVFLHWSFPLIFVWILFLGYQIDAGVQPIVMLSVFFISIFSCVVLHEYGHALTARKYGVNTRDIILSPIGGVARLEKIPSRPIEELLVAIAVPAVNLVIALILLPILLLFRKDGVFPVGESELEVLSQWNNLGPLVLWTNILLIVFNLVPAFPMDGGRVLRSLLAMKLSRVKATKIAFIVAQFCAAGFLIWGLYFGNYILAFIAIFVVLTSRVEWKNVQRAAFIEGQSVSALMRPIHTKLYQDQSIREAIAASSEKEKYFLVFNREDNVAGVLFHEFINHALLEKDTDSPISKYQSNSWQALPSDFPLENAIAVFQQRGYGIVPIIENNSIVGQLDINTLNQFVRNI